MSARFLWPIVGVFGIFTYFYSLDGLYIPHIGDEAPYIEIVRLTAESGNWLPLRTGPGLENTKPPLLYWLGIVATRGARAWSLARLRAPIVLITFLVAGVVFWLSRRLSDDPETAWLAALTFLGFYSTFQYGRPFLTNLPETLFVFSGFSLVLLYRERRLIWVPVGVLAGLACLFKSFALVAPFGLATTWYLLCSRDWRVRELLRRDLSLVVLSPLVALCLFALWPILDPDPPSVLRRFVLEENLGKMSGEDYLSGLIAGPYTLVRLWLGHLGNAGLFAVPLLYLVVVSVRDRHALRPWEKGLWILVLAFLIVYSIPSQRQENYLIPTVPALAILLAARWKEIPTGWFRAFAAPGLLLLAVLLSLVWSIQRDVLPPGGYTVACVAWLFATLAGWLAMIGVPRWGRRGFHAMVFASFLCLAAAVSPFEGSAGRFRTESLERLERRPIYVPERFIRKHEMHRFLLPKARILPYDPSDPNRLGTLLDSGRYVVMHRPVGVVPEGPFRVFARRLDLKSRHTLEEMWRILFRGELHLLVRQELVVRRHRRDRIVGQP